MEMDSRFHGNDTKKSVEWQCTYVRLRKAYIGKILDSRFHGNDTKRGAGYDNAKCWIPAGVYPELAEWAGMTQEAG